MRAPRSRRRLLLLGVLICAACSSPVTSPGQGGDAARLSPSPPPLSSAPKLRRVVGLGDSVPAGANCTCASYVAQLASALADELHKPVGVENLAADGLTSTGLLRQVQQSSVRATPDQVTVVTIGANDLNQRVLSTPSCTSAAALACYQPSLRTMRTNVDAVARLLLSGAGPHGPILLTGYWNVFLDGQVGAAQGPAYVRDSDALTKQANRLLDAVARAHDLVYVDLYQGFKGDGDVDDTALLAPDGDHPSEAGHELITTLLQRALQAPP